MDNAHAHPPPPRPSPATTLPRRVHPKRDHDAQPGSASPSTRQQRLLRTRNAKFPAKKLSISSLSSRFSQLIKSNDPQPEAQSPAPRNHENTAYGTHRDYALSSHSATTFGILEEISNSISSRTKTQHKRQPIPIFQDTPERGLLEESPYVSPSPDRGLSSLINSPAPFDHIQDSLGGMGLRELSGGMGLREISGNARKSSPLESPPTYTASIRGGRRRKSAAKSRFNSEEYIEHIERELELVKDAVYSPNSNRPWKEKLKIAKAENERLRREISEVKSAFEAEVQKTVEHMTSTEFDLKRKIRSLEDELDQKEAKIQSIEHQHDEKRLDQGTVDTLKATIEKLELEKQGLEQDNESVSRRNEVLSQLLALSPTKTQQFNLSSPVRARNNPRPKSMMIPRMPSSPGTNYMSRPQSVVASPTASASNYFSPKQGSASTPPGRFQELIAEEALSPSLRRSLTGSVSRRSTLNSDASVSSSSLDQHQSVSNPLDHPAKQPNPKRRTRRFLHGSTQLKPLLLPTLTGENGVLHSASTTSPGQLQRREFSEESIDPTTTFLSRSPAQYEPEPDSYPFGHDFDIMTQTSRQLAYQSLEGILDGQTMTDSNEYLHNLDHPSSWDPDLHALPTGSVDLSVEDAWASSQQCTLDPLTSSPPQNLQDDFDVTILPAQFEKLAQDNPMVGCGLGVESSPSPAARQISVEIPEPLFSPMSRQRTSRPFTTPNTKRRVFPPQPAQKAPDTEADSSQNSRKRRKLSKDSADFEAQRPKVFNEQAMQRMHTCPTSDEMAPAKALAITPSHSRKSSASSLLLKSPGKAKSPLEILQQRNIGAQPLAAVTIKTIYGTLSRYTTYVREFKRDPLALARRVIANAWHANWKLLGTLSWWVLGLFLGPSNRKNDNTAWDWDEYDGESIADRHCRRLSRALDEQHLRLLPSSQSPERHVHFDKQHSPYRTRGSRSPVRPALKRKLGWGESLLLWGKFSVAIMLAVGGAVVKGPGEMLRDVDERGVPSSWPVQRKKTSGEDRNETSPTRRPFDDAAFKRRSRPIDLPDSTDTKRLKNRSPSPPPSARMLLRSRQFSSSPPQASPSPAFQFGGNQVFEFSSPCRDHDWGDKTLKPSPSKRESLDNLFSSPVTGGAVNGSRDGMREYDPESAGLAFFDPLGDVALDVGGEGRGEEVLENG